MTTAQLIRQAIQRASLETANFGETPDASTLYIPSSHTKALRLESSLVVGGRGVGKSFWTAALQSAELRTRVGAVVKELERTDVRIGFSGEPKIDKYPDASTFASLLDQKNSAYDIWRSVVIRWVSQLAGAHIPNTSWPATINWVNSNPEETARLMEEVNKSFADKNRYGLIIFDALDRTNTDWKVMDEIVRGLLRVALWIKSYPRLFAKIFLREDQAERKVTNFIDASKLLSSKAELSWARHDLHGLLWQRLLNAPEESGEQLRDIYVSATGSPLCESSGTWQLPDEIKRETPTQRLLFEKIAGVWMGKDPRRGVPYNWAVGHLADGRGHTSPRSFLAAILQAAEDSQVRYPDYPLALHYESIKRGIQKASQIRVLEMAEDYPWVNSVMSPLQGLNVPCDFTSIQSRWEQLFPKGLPTSGVDGLPPQHDSWDGIRQDLSRIGIIETKKDGRVDMPDLYRVGFGLGRRGGVKPQV